MPTVSLIQPASAWTKEEKTRSSRSLSKALNSVAEDSSKGNILQVVNVHIHETSKGGYSMGVNVVR